MLRITKKKSKRKRKSLKLKSKRKSLKRKKDGNKRKSRGSRESESEKPPRKKRNHEDIDDENDIEDVEEKLPLISSFSRPKKEHTKVEYIGAYNGRFLFLIESESHIPSWTGYYNKIPVYISDSDDDKIDVNTGGICGDLNLRHEGYHCIKPFFGIVRYSLKKLCSSNECIPLVKNSYIQTPESHNFVSFLLKDKNIDLTEHFEKLKEYYLQTENIHKDLVLQNKFDIILKEYWKEKYIDDISLYFEFIKKCGNIKIFESITLNMDDILEEYNRIKNFSNYRMNIVNHLGEIRHDSYVKFDDVKRYDDNPKNFIKDLCRINKYINTNNLYGLNLGYFGGSKIKGLPYEKEIYSTIYNNPELIKIDDFL